MRCGTESALSRKSESTFKCTCPSSLPLLLLLLKWAAGLKFSSSTELTAPVRRKMLSVAPRLAPCYALPGSGKAYPGAEGGPQAQLFHIEVDGSGLYRGSKPSGKLRQSWHRGQWR